MRFATVRDSFIDLERRQQGQERPPGPKLVRLWCEFLFICAILARRGAFVKLYFAFLILPIVGPRLFFRNETPIAADNPHEKFIFREGIGLWFVEFDLINARLYLWGRVVSFVKFGRWAKVVFHLCDTSAAIAICQTFSSNNFNRNAFD